MIRGEDNNIVVEVRIRVISVYYFWDFGFIIFSGFISLKIKNFRQNDETYILRFFFLFLNIDICSFYWYLASIYNDIIIKYD